MTREDAIKTIESAKHFAYEDVYAKAFDLAIKALEQEPTTKNNLGVDCISRADALDCVNIGITFCDVYKKINDLPAVTPQEPKTGHWIESDAVLVMGNLEKDNFLSVPAKECSICHKPHIRAYGMDYCPNCGAKMAESEDT